MTLELVFPLIEMFLTCVAFPQNGETAFGSYSCMSQAVPFIMWQGLKDFRVKKGWEMGLLLPAWLIQPQPFPEMSLG